MKKFSKVLLCFMILLLTACVGNNEVKNYYGKKFIGKNGGEIIITEKVVTYSGEPSKINPNSNPNDVNKAKDKMKKENATTFNNPKIVKKGDKKYLTADKLEYKLLFVDDETILDEDDNYEFKLSKDSIYK
ncbi:hypothetical protein [Parvimonas micra]|uniref:hypothetical protein n=1 Tax=Parvimonas micra TaxID=33033 RepID=UPI0022B64D0E|nr:hypothetical protein [Parvimonas micra]MCZ7409079.1 hypothetical protein [Parvimonas micra]